VGAPRWRPSGLHWVLVGRRGRALCLLGVVYPGAVFAILSPVNSNPSAFDGAMSMYLAFCCWSQSVAFGARSYRCVVARCVALHRRNIIRVG
jgi:hypothetical protein